MNLTPPQRDLLFEIVDGHLSGDGSRFTFMRSHSGSAVRYDDGREVQVHADDMDLRQLEMEGFITLERLPGPLMAFSGQSTRIGIATVASLKSKPAPGTATSNDGGRNAGITSVEPKRDGPLGKNPLPKNDTRHSLFGQQADDEDAAGKTESQPVNPAETMPGGNNHPQTEGTATVHEAGDDSTHTIPAQDVEGPGSSNEPGSAVWFEASALPRDPVRPSEVPATANETEVIIAMPKFSILVPQISKELGPELVKVLEAFVRDIENLHTAFADIDWNSLQTGIEAIQGDMAAVEENVGIAVPLTAASRKERLEFLRRFSTDLKGLGLPESQFWGMMPYEWMGHYHNWERSHVGVILSNLTGLVENCETPLVSDVVQAAQSLAPFVGKPDRGNLAILRGTDGELRRAVTLDVARRFGGVTRRAIEDAARKGTLKTEGNRQQRRVLVDSLLKYFPPEK